MKITKEYLKSLNACSEQVCLFSKTFPNGTLITRSACKKAARAGLDLSFLATRIFNAPARKAYNEAITPARKAYNEAFTPARKAYEEARAPALKAFDEARAPALKAFDEAFASARKAFDEAITPARKAYDEARGVAFYNAWKGLK